MSAPNQLVHEPVTSMKRAVVLDIDNTLTPPQRPLELEMARALRALTVPFFLGAGGDLRLVREQFIKPLHEFGYRGSFDAFLCNGPRRYHCELFEASSVSLIRDFRVRDYIGEECFARLLRILETALDMAEFRLPSHIRIFGERIVDRESMINVAPIGRPRERLTDEMHLNRLAFKEFDNCTEFRRRFLSHLTLELAGVSPEFYLALGGETSFDIGIEGNDKSYPLRTLLNEGFERIWYVGDALFEGGNDEAVLKFIERWPSNEQRRVEARRVQSFHDTIRVLNTLGVLGEIAK